MDKLGYSYFRNVPSESVPDQTIIFSPSHNLLTRVTFGMTTLPHLMRQPRSQRSQRRRRRRRVLLAVLLGAALAGGAYLVH